MKALGGIALAIAVICLAAGVISKAAQGMLFAHTANALLGATSTFALLSIAFTLLESVKAKK